ncbi:MAG: ABC-2 family transporter protein [Kofleriaceae bacterium]
MSARATLRALPAMLRVGVAETVAYRAEYVVWLLTTTLPLVMLALWTSVAAEGPFQGYAAQDFVAYYLAALIVRNVTGSWVSWQINDELRRGVLAMRLLRPVHPFVAYAATHVASVPLRAMIAMPVAGLLLVTSARDALTDDVVRLALLVPSLALAWGLTFAILLCLGCLAFFLERSLALADVYFGLFAVLSGYLVPLPLLPTWIQDAARYSPFRFVLSAPIELLLDPALDRAGALGLAGAQLAWALAMLALALTLWRRGVRRFEAVGG